MRLEFNCISELGEPGFKFKGLFDKYWPEYRTWLDSNTMTTIPDLDTSISALHDYMPEMMPTYLKLCNLVNADAVAAQFLTGFQPPPYLSACSQAVSLKDDIQLVRNYDFHHALLEGTLLLSSWHGKKVISTTDCLMGAIDGMNENGLAISLTFGGRKIVGDGFGIPFILRYVLEFCDTVDEAVKALVRIPCHMAYNVTVVDKSGIYKTILLSPDNDPLVTDDAYTTNHQTKIDWASNAKFNKTVERAEYLKKLLQDETLTADNLTNAFLEKPLYNNLFSKGFGTLYTVDYRPLAGTTQLRWLDNSIIQSFHFFTEMNTVIKYADAPKILGAAMESSTIEEEETTNSTRQGAPWEIITDYAKKYERKPRKFNYNNK